VFGSYAVSRWFSWRCGRFAAGSLDVKVALGRMRYMSDLLLLKKVMREKVDEHLRARSMAKVV